MYGVPRPRSAFSMGHPCVVDDAAGIRSETAMLGPRSWRTARKAALPEGLTPRLLVIVDTEEEFDWSRSLSRDNQQVRSIAAQDRAQDVYVEYRIKPTYVVDYPVAADAAAARRLAAYYENGYCELGAHLHPWVNPPHTEDVTPRNSYPGNLPAPLERAKLETLTHVIETNLGVRPRIYKAGRYGVGISTGRHLADLGYKVDLSIVPYTSFEHDGGPSFLDYDPAPYWFGSPPRLLEVPLSCAFAGGLARFGPWIYPVLNGAIGAKACMPGIFARLRLLERIRLSPEGMSFEELRRLTDTMVKQGHRVFSFTYHSPSLTPGNTPYVQTKEDLDAFVNKIRRYCRYFVDELGGCAISPLELYDLLAGADAERPSTDSAAIDRQDVK